MARKAKYTYGFVDVPRGGPLTATEAAFADEKRAQGIPDVEIAKMLGCTLAVLARGVVVDEGFASACDPEAQKRENDERQAWMNERRERNRVARGLTTWHADKPNPLAADASFPPELRAPKSSES